ncbi:PQQ-dependent sugar dehydrogenase [Fulvivirgaceae bacterium PWU4]|uniref:PQQ-dependent sugar dehydrogenase n=1 Tax=Chryseosolibacter histidini TaxID=2782349 RepID=A0AAP2DHH3_9BACT|nr:PQQ-dependent sugar dehydrogenase [Chryseosolibacter histidini]MBT1696483.1 PQQ-dependent sugar dehydrogenase [Chryseosolibacter histidini]
MKRHMLQSAAYAAFIFLTGYLLISCDDWFGDDDDDDKKSTGANYVDHLDTPWEMTFAPDGRMFVTQRPGSIVVIENNEQKVWAELDSVVEEVGESGLFGIEIDPEFSQNRFVYFAYTYAASKSPLRLMNKIVRYKDNAGTPVFDKVIIDGIEGNYLHNVGALEFGPDGMLYCTVGEIFRPELAQDKSVLNGKILRMTRDGAVPADNPFPGSYIYSLGHRNPQGIAFQPGTNQLWSTEHGPSEEQGCCMDEINRIMPGRNYGWPVIRGGQQQAGYETPVYNSGDTATWAPTGGVFLTQGDWSGSMLFTGLRGKALYRAVFNASDPSKIDKVERYLYNVFGRLRNVAEGPDGRIYIAVSNQDGRGDPSGEDDRIVVMTQKELASQQPDLK